MGLYTKGKRNYFLTKEFYSIHMTNIKNMEQCNPNGCPTISDCSDCTDKKKDYDLYAKELIITRLYYALMQILYSSIDSDPNEWKDHRYLNYKNRVMIEFKTELDVNLKTTKMHILNEMLAICWLRHDCDYKIVYHISDFEIDIERIDNLYNHLESLRSD